MRNSSEATTSAETPTHAPLDLTLRARGLGISFADQPVVQNVSFAIPRGEALALVGESGSGKSITAKSLMGLLPPSAHISTGEALFRGAADTQEAVDVLALEDREMRAFRGAQMGMIFQEPMSSLSPFHTIGAQVSEALQLHCDERGAAAKAKCIETFKAVGFPDPERAYRAYPFELSGGLRQRAMIAMAMICRPALLIADEPTTALDVSTQALILDLLACLREEYGLSLLLITHDLGVVANAAKYMSVMAQGRIVEAGETREILSRPQHLYTRRLIEAAPRIDVEAHRKALAGAPKPASPKPAADAPLMDPLSKHPIGPLPDPVGDAEIEFKHDAQAGPKGPKVDYILQASDLAKTYISRSGPFWEKPRKIMALRGVDFHIPRGKTIALVGESGSGKTTLAKILMRATDPDPGGKLLYDSGDGKGPREVTRMGGPALQAFRREAQFVFQDPFSALSPRMTVQDILTEPLKVHRVGARADQIERAGGLLERVGLERTALGRFPHAFSGGQRQRIAIARSLALSPKLLLCDEPTSALDVSVQAQVLDLLEELRDEMGLSYLFISHDLAVVARLADEIAVMCRGAIVEQASTDRIFAEPQHPYTKALIAAAPEPDADVKLDLAAVRAGAEAEPENWPAPFSYPRETPPPLIEIAPDHLVRRTELAS